MTVLEYGPNVVFTLNPIFAFVKIFIKYLSILSKFSLLLYILNNIDYKCLSVSIAIIMNRIFFIVLTFFCLSKELISQSDYRLYAYDTYSVDYEFEDSATWIASSGGLVKIDHVTEEIVHFNQVNSGLEGLKVNEIEIDNNNVKWVTTDYGLYTYDDVEWTKIDFPEFKNRPIDFLKVSEEGSVWIVMHPYTQPSGTSTEFYILKDNELIRHTDKFPANINVFDFTSDTMAIVVTKDRKVHSFDGENVIELLDFTNYDGKIMDGAFDKNGDYIFASQVTISPTFPEVFQTYTYNYYKLKDGQVELIFEEEGFPIIVGYKMHYFLKDTNDDLWFQRYWSGDEAGSSFTKFTNDGIELHTYESLGINLPDSNSIRFLRGFDFNNNMWIRTNDNRSPMTYKANANEVKSYKIDLTDVRTTGFHNGQINEDCDGRVYVSSNNGIYKFEEEEFSLFPLNSIETVSPIPIEMELNPITCELWVSYDPDSEEQMIIKDGSYSFENTGHQIFEIEFDDDGTGYFSTREGLLITEPDGTEDLIPNSQIPFDLSFSVMRLGKEKDLWIHARDHNIYKYQNGNWITFNQNENPFGLFNSTPILLDQNNHLWTTTDVGLAKYDGNSWEIFEHEMGNSFRYVFKQDKYNNIWIGTWDGLTVFDGTTFNDLNVYNTSLSSNNIYELHFQNNDDIWVNQIQSLLIMKNEFAQETSSVDNFEEEDLVLNIFPNPSNGVFTIDLPNDKIQESKINLFDYKGSLITQKNVHSFPASFEIKNSGIYILKVETGSGSYVQRIIKL